MKKVFQCPSNHLKNCQTDNAFLIGDALGLAQPMTGEGILPSVLSGKLCATAIAEGQPETYAQRLRTHPVISDYRMIHELQTRAKKIFKNKLGRMRIKMSIMSQLGLDRRT